MSDDGGVRITAGAINAKEMSQQDMVKGIALLTWFLQHVITAAQSLVYFPREVHAFFQDDLERKVRFNWAHYGLWGVHAYALGAIVFGIVRCLFTNEPWTSMGSYISFAIFMVLFGGFFTRRIEAYCRKAGNRLAWTPGVGYKGHDGEFHPMNWPKIIQILPQLRPRRQGDKLLNVTRNLPVDLKKGMAMDAKEAGGGTDNFLPKAENLPFALGPANVGEQVLRGTKVINGFSYRQKMENQARQEGGLNGGLLTFGAVPMMFDAEPQHLMISGKSGAGKTQEINAILRTARDWRGNAALIADPAGGYLARFGRDTDSVLNPFDARSESWSPFADGEIVEDYDCATIAMAVIPDGEGSSGEWNHYGQSLLTEVLKALWKAGEKDPTRVLYYCASAPADELQKLLIGTPAAIITQKENNKMLGNIRGIISTYMGAWQYLKPNGDFSIRKFVRESDTNGGAFLFMTYTDAQMSMLKGLIAAWMELAVIEGLSLTESEGNAPRRLWYVLDELDSLGKISSLKLGLTKLRKYGVCCICGIQTIAQLRATYGRDDAQTLLSCMATKLILPPGDNETADYMSKELGEQEIERVQVSQGESNKLGELAGHNTNQHMHRQTQAAVMPSQLLSLPNLQGYLRMPGSDVFQVVIPYQSMPDKNLPFERAPK
jgi:type IV secretory pathway TraG/TraD family ATPase VirD4